MALNRDAILAADDLVREEIDVPEWGGTVFVRVMTARERDRFEQKWSESRYDNIRAFLAVCVVCDEAGLPLFSEKDIDALGRKSAAALDRIFDVASRVNKLTPQDIEDLEGNSDASRSDDSFSASHLL
jgi:hypothetical protein